MMKVKILFQNYCLKKFISSDDESEFYSSNKEYDLTSSLLNGNDDISTLTDSLSDWTLDETNNSIIRIQLL